MFGETDPDEEVSPDTEDPEAKEAGDAASNGGDKNGAVVQRQSTRQWVQEVGYDPEKLLN